MIDKVSDILKKRIARLRFKHARAARRKYHLRLKIAEFQGDPNFALSLVDRGLKPHALVPKEEESILRRIEASYRKAHDRQKEMDSCFQVSNEWVPIFNRSMGEVQKALLSADYQALQLIYRNFMRDPCSTGLVGLTNNMQQDFFSGRIKRKLKLLYLIDLLHRYRLWKGLLGDVVTIDALSAPYFGNPYGTYIDGIFIKAGSDYLHYYAAAIKRLLRQSDRSVVVELGGGYGGMAYYLLRDAAKLTYVDFDLPENMALTGYYLLSSFPEKRVLLYGESDLNDESIRNNDIVLMPNFEIASMPDKCADLVFNSYSLAEMSPQAIRRYIQEFGRIVRAYILHVNHTRHSIVSAGEFGIESMGFDLLYKIPALWNAGRNPDTDEYEFLYKKSK